jgi:hypothetical protein
MCSIIEQYEGVANKRERGRQMRIVEKNVDRAQTDQLSRRFIHTIVYLSR